MKTAQYLAKALSPYRRRKLAKMLADLSRPESERQPRTCPLCQFHGHFEAILGADALRFDAECPSCKSRERHRFIKLWLDRHASSKSLGDFIHFAHEEVLARELRPRCSRYRTADIEAGRADMVLDMEDIDLPDASIDTLMANHVLEHVDDRKALRELRRILKVGGLAILTVPVISNWRQSYEDPSLTTPEERYRHFGQTDHVRFFGGDIEERIRAAGFDLETVVADGAESARYGLIRGDTIYLATRPAT